MDQLRPVASTAPAGLASLCDTLLGCFGHEREDGITMPVLPLG